jgi:hypothetical protein
LNFESASFRDLGRLLQETVAAEGGISVSMHVGSVYGRQFDLKALGLDTHTRITSRETSIMPKRLQRISL